MPASPGTPAIDIPTALAKNIVNPLIVALFVAGLFYFLWGIVKYMRNTDAPDERAKGARHMIWAVVGMAIMVAAFAIIRLILDITNSPAPEVLSFLS